MQEHADALLAAIRSASLSDSDLRGLNATGSIPSERVQLLNAIAAFVNDRRLAAILAPSADSYAYLFRLLIAVGGSPLAQQSGAGAYALLSPVLHALRDVAQLTAGEDECWQPLLELARHATRGAGKALWTRALLAAQQLTANGASPR